MEPNCHNCQMYQKKKCILHQIKIEDPDKTTCLKFTPSNKTSPSYLYIMGGFILISGIFYYFIH